MSAKVHEAHARLTKAFSLDRVPTVADRIARLKALDRALTARQPDLIAAVNRDFSPRAEVETLTAELAYVREGLRQTIRRLPSWAKERQRRVLRPLPGATEIWREPKGVVGILSPWNYPLQLALLPMISAVAAGNRVLVKPSERAPHSAEALADLVHAVFPEDEAVVLTGGVDVAEALTALPLGHLFYTGSTAIGRKVAMAAAKTLTPVTLELGGRSPAVALAGASPGNDAAIIAWGRWLNAGQTCVAPNHLWVPRGSEMVWAEALLKRAEGFLPHDFTGLIDDRAAQRARDLLADAEAHGAQVLRAGTDDPDGSLGPAIVIDPPVASDVMREEIFAPILPILPYDTPEDILRAEAGTTPLAAYVFGETKAARAFLKRLRSGGGTVNATLLHLAAHDLPFGGIGESGYGAYHGERGFREFSHERAVFTALRGPWLRLIAPPYSNRVRAMLERMSR